MPILLRNTKLGPVLWLVYFGDRTYDSFGSFCLAEVYQETKKVTVPLSVDLMRQYGLGQYNIVWLRLINPNFGRFAENFQIASQGLRAYDVGLGAGKPLHQAALRHNSNTA